MNFPTPYVILDIGKAPTPKVDAPRIMLNVLTDAAYPVGRQDRHFYFFLLSLSLVRKARNATIKLPKVANKVSIPRKIEIISNAVILRTSLPMYSQQARALAREAAIFASLRLTQKASWKHSVLSWVLFPEKFSFPLAYRHAHNHSTYIINFQLIYIIFSTFLACTNFTKLHKLPPFP